MLRAAALVAILAAPSLLPAISPVLRAQPQDQPQGRNAAAVTLRLGGPPAAASVGFACVSARGPEVLAVGRRWRAAFGRGDVEFRPALGRHAPRALPLRLALAGIRRGATAVPAALETDARRVDEERRTVTFVRQGGAVLERYEARPDGCELTFTFAAPPPGEGDLVVELAVETDLPAAEAAGPGLRWHEPGLGGVTLGAVTGVDAAGAEVAGTVRRTDRGVELALPGRFVDDAAYPLVLDPLIGPAIDSLPGFDNDFPDVAHEPSSDSFCVVWTLFSGGGQSDVVGAVYRRSDLGRAYAFAVNQNGAEYDPRVAAIGGMGVYVLAWSNVTGPASGVLLTCMALEPLGGLGSPLYAIAGPGNVSDARLSGEATPFDDDCPVVWDDAALGVCGSTITVFHDLTLGIPAPVVIGGGADAHEVAISKQGGGQGLHLVTWVDRPPGLPGWVRAQVVDHDMTLIGTGAWIQDAPLDAARPAVDGDGSLFLFAWQQQERAVPAATDVHGRMVTLGPGGITSLGPVLDLAVYPTFLDGAPDVGLLGDKFGLVYQSGIAGSPWVDDVFFRTVERSGAPCGDELQVDLTAGHAFEHAPRIVGRRDGDHAAQADDGLVVFADQGGTTADSDVGLQRVESMGAGGAVVDAGGGCGGAAVAGLCAVHGPCALGNDDFEIELFGAATLAVPFLGIGFPGPVLTCGVCALTDPWVFQFAPNVAGTARATLPLPCEPKFLGVTVEMQWVTFQVAYVGCPQAPGLAASNRVHATLDY